MTPALLLRRVHRAVALVLVAAAAVTAGSAVASAAPPPRVTVFGDSVQASFGFAPQAVRRLAPGLRLRMEARVCRKLSSPGCLGGSPESVLAVAGSLGPSLGDVVVVHVGYNDFASRYDIEAALRTFRRAGVRAVVWVTLREAHRHYATTNALIRAASQRAARRQGLPIVRVADWNSFGVGRPWFTSDGVHLNSAGALGLATLLRESVLSALADVGTSVDGRPVTTRSDVFPLGRRVAQIAGDGDVLWSAGAGRLAGLDERSGRRLPRVAGLGLEEDLVSDGRQAWLRDPAAGAITRPGMRAPELRGPLLDGVGSQPLLARAGAWLWAISPCQVDGVGCPAGQILRGARSDSGERRESALTSGRVLVAAADARGLWLLVTDNGEEARLERRDPQTGLLLRRTRLPKQAAAGVVVAGRKGAWVLTGNSQLLGVGRGGRTRKVTGRVRAIAALDDQLWAVEADRRTVLNLHPLSGRARGRAVADRPLSRQMTFTHGHLWVLAASGRQVLRLRRV